MVWRKRAYKEQEEPWAEVATLGGELEAKQKVDALRRCGIEVNVISLGAPAAAAFVSGQPAPCRYQLWVKKRDVARAQQVLGTAGEGQT